MSKNLSFNSIKFHEFSGYEPKDITFMGELFIDQCHSYMEELTIFFETDAAEDWHDVAHGFKGMAAFAGADALYELCLKAQNHYMDNKIIKKQILDDIKMEISRVSTLFTDYLSERLG